ncbi:hypothetical protein MAR_009129 [Mya arenaria]|uniref:Caspase family p20 domain-containing protein n=2 Tax=Mya arenaria TaxID=6604 RepID=A0ABY7E0U9_MYAAR|nr:hypothetical protein MAR_009129 [Mya arenaria]
MKRVGRNPPFTGHKRMAMDIQSDISNPNVGAAIIFGNYGTPDNSNTFQFRKGGEKDLDNVQSVFIKSLGFDWLNKDNSHNLFINQWDHTKIRASGQIGNCRKCLKCLIKNTDFKRYKYFVLAISSHGFSEKGEQFVQFLSSTDYALLSLSEVLEAISDKQCPTLAANHGFVIVQACRTDSEFPDLAEDHGVVFNLYTEQGHEEFPVNALLKEFGHLTIDESNAGLMDTDEVSEDAAPPTARQGNVGSIKVLVQADEKDETKLKIPNNFLVIYPTAPYRYSKRNETEGSWFEFYLKEVVDEYEGHSTELDFFQVLTETNQRVSNRETVVYKRNSAGKIQYDPGTESPSRDEDKSGKKNVVWIEHRITQPLVFRLASGN